MLSECSNLHGSAGNLETKYELIFYFFIFLVYNNILKNMETNKVEVKMY